MKNEKIYSSTRSVCSICNNILNAQIVEKDNKVYLKKNCPDHSIHYELFCSDAKWYKESRSYIKPAQFPNDISVKEFKDCPDSCGLCPEHQQHTCLPVIEITSKCDLNCPICLKDFNNEFELTIEEFTGIITRLEECEGRINLINLSGGEPTLHPQIKNFLKIAKKLKVVQVSISTNGLELLNNLDLRNCIKETDSIVALQFDGFDSDTYNKLRGEDLLKSKLELIKILERENINYSLVSTIMSGVNENQVNKITDFFFNSKALSLMFQPVVYTGNAEKKAEEERITIPDVIKELEKSTFISKGDFNPLPCSHFTCFALSYYIHIEENKYMSLKEFLGKENYLNVIANRTLPGMDQEGISIIKERIYEFWSASDSMDLSDKVLKRIRHLIDEINKNAYNPSEMFSVGARSMKGVFIHQFMDKQTMDFGRLIKCCNHYPIADGRLIPMCAQNVFKLI